MKKVLCCMLLVLLCGIGISGCGKTPKGIYRKVYEGKECYFVESGGMRFQFEDGGNMKCIDGSEVYEATYEITDQDHLSIMIMKYNQLLEGKVNPDEKMEKDFPIMKRDGETGEMTLCIKAGLKVKSIIVGNDTYVKVD